MLRNHRGEHVTHGDPRTGTHRARANEERECMRCKSRIAVGDEYAADLVEVCIPCSDDMDRILRVRNHVRALAAASDVNEAILHGGYLEA